MSLVTFGNLGSPTGLAVAWDDAALVPSLPYGVSSPLIVRPGPQGGIPIRNTLSLAVDYFPLPVADAYGREGNWQELYRVPAGTSIVCSAEEAACLYAAGAVRLGV